MRRHAEHLARGVLENPLLDVAGARRIADALIAALGRAAGLDRYRLAWLLSATAYFCEHSDRYHDVQDLIGLEDDAFVVSAVLDHCGMHALARSIRGGGS